MEALEPLTPEYPRESFRARLINYAPSILIVGFMFLVPGPLAYSYCRAGTDYVGMWGYFPLALVTAVLAGYILFLYWTCSPNLRSLDRPADMITKTCRAACILAHVLVFVALWNSGMIAVALAVNPDEDETETFRRVKIFLAACNTLGMIYVMYWTYSTCRVAYYEKAIMRANAQRYGDPVVVCIPVFKLCGHFVLYTSTHKYELRLDRTSSFRPYFLHRPLRPSELSSTISPQYHLFVCGWTSRTHEDIVRTFDAAIQEFGPYNRLTNNCRTFLQWGCMGILDLTSVWHEDMLMVEVGRPLIFPKMALMMYRAMLRDLCRCFCAVRWGPDWESHVHYEGGLVDLADHDVDLTRVFER
ncbi:hypothetical protein FB451DRAFT_638481 [Mycena latifolia]|nr:hypothetical protein FB451DRAFT_638481 [Mycena latifolia]